MTPRVLFGLQYDLTRRQRLVGLCVAWLPAIPLILCLLFSPLFIFKSLWVIPLAGLGFWFTSGFFLVLADIIGKPRLHMDILLEENGLGFLDVEERWYVLLDGVLSIRRICRDTWTIKHHNGTVISIPTSAITQEQVELLRSAVQAAKARALPRRRRRSG